MSRFRELNIEIKLLETRNKWIDASPERLEMFDEYKSNLVKLSELKSELEDYYSQAARNMQKTKCEPLTGVEIIMMLVVFVAPFIVGYFKGPFWGVASWVVLLLITGPIFDRSGGGLCE